MILSSTKKNLVAPLLPPKRRVTPERWVLERVLRHGWLITLALVGSIGAIALYSLGAVQIGALIEVVTVGRITPLELGQLSLVLLAVLAGRGVVALIGSLSAQTLAQRLERDIRDEVFNNLLGKSQTFHNRQKTGDLMARTINDVDAVSGMVYPGSTMILDSLVNAVMPLVAIALLEPRLLAMPVIFLLVFTLSIRRYSSALDELSGTARWRFGMLNARIAEAVQSFETIKAFRQQTRTEREILEDASAYRDLVRRQGRLQGAYPPTLIYGVCFALGVGHALWLGSEGVALGVIVAFIGLFGQLRYPMSISSYSFWLLSWGRGGAERLQELLATDSSETSGSHTQTLRGHFRLEGVGLNFDGHSVLNDIDLEIREGETVALVGPTGSGKTLLSQLLNRTYEPSSGRLWIDGLESRSWDPKALRSQMASVEQDVFLFARSVADNIAFGRPDATRAEIEHAARQAQAEAFILELPQGFNTMLGERGVTLSGGQRQRLALARALLVNAPMMILDDATSAIDSVTEASLQTAMRNAATGRTTLVITNRLSQVLWADRIVLMQSGRIVAQGSHAQLLESSELYRRLFSSLETEEVSA
jgi:ATP-binding cassette, subfamily B, bacterial